MKRDLPPGGPLPDPDDEVREEIRFYLDERTREIAEAEGIPSDEARRRAEAAFGNVERVASEVGRIGRGRRRHERRAQIVGSLAQDLKLAFRGLWRRPGFSLVVVGTVALGVGAVTAVFSVVNASLLRALPFDDADRLVFVQGAYDAPEGPAIRGASVPEALDWRSMSRSFSGLAAVDVRQITLTGQGVGEELTVEEAGPDYFDVLRVSPILGRLFTAEELALPSDERVALLGESLWRDRFGEDPDILGHAIRLDGQTFTVVGVLPAGFRGTSLRADLFLPLGNPAVGVRGSVDSRGTRFLTVVARLRSGVTLAAAREDMDGVAKRLEEAYPEAHEDRIALVTPLREVYLGSTQTLVLLVLAASALLLLIAAANVANLFLVRASDRGGEALMRKALGASRWRLVAPFLSESMLSSGVGAALGLFLGVYGARALATLMGTALLPAYVEIRPDVRVYVVTAGLLLLVGLAAGVPPALTAAQTDVASGLRGGSRHSGRHSRLRSGLVVAEVALALLLLVGAGLLTRSFRAQLAIDSGFDADSLYAFTVTLPAERYAREAVPAAVRDLEGRLGEARGVEGVAYGADAPLRGGYQASYLYLEGSEAADRIRFYVHRVSADWFQVLGTDLLAGRPLGRADLDDPNVTVVGRALAERFFPSGTAVGGTLRLFSPDGQQLRIVGVAEDARFRDLTTDLVAGADDPDIYVMWDSLPSRSVSFVLRSRIDPASIERTVRSVVGDFDRDLAVTNAAPLSQALAGQIAQARFGALLLTGFSALAAFLALVGLYGVLSFTVERRRREIAIRMAVGAEAAQVRLMVVLQGLRLTSVGLVVGLAFALLLGRTLGAFLYDVRPVDVATYAAVLVIMIAVAAVAAWLPALRATRVQPQRALARPAQ